MKRRKPISRLGEFPVNVPEVFVDITDVGDIALGRGVKVIKKRDRITIVIPAKQQRVLARKLAIKGFELVPVSKAEDIVVSVKPNEYIGVRRRNRARIPVRQSSPKMYVAVAKGGRVYPKPGGKKNGGNTSEGKQGGK